MQNDEIHEFIKMNLEKNNDWYDTNEEFIKWLEKQIDSENVFTFEHYEKRPIKYFHFYLPKNISDEMKIKYMNLLHKKNMIVKNQLGKIINDKEGELWLKTPNGKEWLDNKTSIDWFGLNCILNWLCSENGKNWLLTDKGTNWLKTFDYESYYKHNKYINFQNMNEKWKKFTNTTMGKWWIENTKYGKKCILNIQSNDHKEKLKETIELINSMSNAINKKASEKKTPSEHISYMENVETLKKLYEMKTKYEKDIELYKQQIQTLDLEFCSNNNEAVTGIVIGYTQ